MKDAKSNHGLFVRGAGTCVTATNCKFTGNGMSGVAVLAQVCAAHSHVLACGSFELVCCADARFRACSNLKGLPAVLMISLSPSMHDSDFKVVCKLNAYFAVATQSAHSFDSL
jgi:hypothetical protein